MRNNQPVTQREYDYAADMMLVSSTDTKGHITHCNRAFIEASGFDADELIGQPHNLVRHPDMPPEAYRDMWRTIGNGLPWSGVVKNRRKNGDHYWVQANVTPIMEGGKPVGYMSVRTKPTRDQVAQAEALYARLNQNAAGLSLHQGRVQRAGPAGWSARWRHASGDFKLGVILSLMVVVSLGPALLPIGEHLAYLIESSGLVLGALLVMWWFRTSVSGPLKEARRLARDIAACNLSSTIHTDAPEPAGSLLRSLSQIQVNLQAIVGDVRREIDGFSETAVEIALATDDLSKRTESQASSLEQTAASMEQLAATVRSTADNSTEMARQTSHSAEVAQSGQQAIHAVSTSMGEIEHSSKKMRDIIATIEGIAFQTNILALNAAVEAARAGEQGRGFAVVAGEVRSLAQRTAEASKDIRGLIQTSVDQVSAGSGQMKAANLTVDEVVKEIQGATVLVNEILSATNEQSEGLLQINQAVVQLDTVTQQNAAMVEQTSAAAEQLRQGSDLLRQSVSVFRLR
jgi:aerotaxis receptor